MYCPVTSSVHVLLQRNRHDELVSKRQDEIEELVDQLRNVRRINGEMAMDIEDLQYKIAQT